MWIALAVIVAVLTLVGVVFNSLQTLRTRAEEAWADIDTQLKRRHDLIPNLVETVKGYMGHERTTLENVVKARTTAMQARTPGERAQAEEGLALGLKNLFALAENYPQLRAVEGFNQLQQNLSQIEDQIQLARRYYNAVVRDLNTKIRTFPSNLVAGMFSFREREFFEIGAAEREPVKVQF